MSSKNVNVSNVKQKLKSIIENLKYLENSKGNEENLVTLQQKMLCMLNDVEALPLETIKSRVKKRQKRRQKTKLKKQQIKRMNIKLAKIITPISTHNQEAIDETNNAKHLITNEKHLITKKSYQQLKTIHEGQRFLKIFSLLEELHLRRGQNSDETKKFARKFERLITVWKTFILEKQNSDETIENQWNISLFGNPYHENFDLETFLRRRTIWDSYVSSKGSSIPAGWVLPPKLAHSKWSAYLCSSNP
uniref:Uncharacterized protein n=1 Tax=Glossina brevipalpis TaxID=37001 RepID=A0A1A9WF68_9MUSC